MSLFLALGQGAGVCVTGVVDVTVVCGIARIHGADVGVGESVRVVSPPWEPSTIVSCVNCRDLRLPPAPDAADVWSEALERVATSVPRGDIANYHRCILRLASLPCMERYLTDFACGVDLSESFAPDWGFSVPGAFLSVLVRDGAVFSADAVAIRCTASSPPLAGRRRRVSAPASCRAVARALSIPAAWESVASDVVSFCAPDASRTLARVPVTRRPAVVVVAGPKGSGALVVWKRRGHLTPGVADI